MNDKIDELLKQFKKELCELRKWSKLTQKQVATKLGITHQSYQAYESGKAVPSFQNFLKLCEIFDVSPNDFFGKK